MRRKIWKWMRRGRNNSINSGREEGEEAMAKQSNSVDVLLLMPGADEATIQNSSILDEWEEDLMRLDVSTRRQRVRRRSSFFSRGGRTLLEEGEEE
eukprot:15365543-Ditylum_brightwellii.AAC.5